MCTDGGGARNVGKSVNMVISLTVAKTILQQHRLKSILVNEKILLIANLMSCLCFKTAHPLLKMRQLPTTLGKGNSINFNYEH